MSVSSWNEIALLLHQRVQVALFLCFAVSSSCGMANEPDVQVDPERRLAISKQFELLQQMPFVGSVSTQWAHLIQRELRELSYDEAREIAHKWCNSGGNEGFTALVASVCKATIDPPKHIQFVKYHFSDENTAAVADKFSRVLTPDSDVLKLKGVVDVTLPGERIIAKPRVEQLRFHPPVKLPLVAQSCENAGDALHFRYYSSSGKMTLECTVDDSGFVSEWSTTRSGEATPTELVLQAEPAVVVAGYFPKRSIRLRFHQSVLNDFTVYEVFEVKEGVEISAETLAVAVPEGTTVMDNREKQRPHIAIAKKELANWDEAFDTVKNRLEPPSRWGMRSLFLLANAIVFCGLVCVYVVRSNRSRAASRTVKEDKC